MVPIIVIALLPFIPETPRWYIQHGGQIDQARASLRRVRDTEQEVEDEILYIREALEVRLIPFQITLFSIFFFSIEALEVGDAFRADVIRLPLYLSSLNNS